MRRKKIHAPQSSGRDGERGAALITALLLSFMLLAAGGFLMLATSFTISNSFDPTSEMQAYYAAEGGLQATLNTLRGNVAPNISLKDVVRPITSNYAGDASPNARLSKWLGYNYPAAGGEVVTLAAPYSALSGSAYSAVLSDPDNSSVVSFTTADSTFSNGTQALAVSNKVSITFTPTTVTSLSTYPSATSLTSGVTSTLGTFTTSVTGNNNATIPANTTFNLVIRQTKPWAATRVVTGTLQGTLSNLASTVTLTFDSTSYSLEGVPFSISSTNPLPIVAPNVNSGATLLQALVAAPEPRRVLVRVTGFGPRGARKNLQTMIGKFALDYSPRGTIALRGADPDALGNYQTMSFNAGNSAAYTYSGIPTTSPQAISSFLVTNTPDYNLISGLATTGQVTGAPPVVQVAVSSLPSWLQTSDGARALLNQIQPIAQDQQRYFTTATPPTDFGSSANPLLTFVDGDVDLPTSGGGGLLVVTGTLYLRGSSTFDGLVLVLGGGTIIRDGGGNGTTLGALALASFDRYTAGAPFRPPTFNSNGSGASTVRFDPNSVNRALGLTGRRVYGVSEY